jgi:predicted enzyme related to lactoylglutathione lyase
MAIPHGKVCYLQIPAADVERSAEFYSTVFGWGLRRRGDGSLAFDDTDGSLGVSGTWVTGRPPHTAPGILVWIMVDDVAVTLDAIIAAGGDVVEPISGEAPEFVATFRDPAGNVLGVGQQ